MRKGITAPGGLGVRDGILFLLFAGVGVASSVAAPVAMGSRLLFILEDVTWYVLVVVLGRTRLVAARAP